MAGAIGTGGGGQGRRALDTDINMVPMIDLLMVTIAFLLVTAVWSQMSRIEGSAQVPGNEGIDRPVAEKSLHVDMRSPDRFVLSWREGQVVGRSVEVPREYPALARAIAGEWRSGGVHTSPADVERDQAVLHTADDTPFKDMVAVMDAIEATRRPLLRGDAPAFALKLSTQ
jgi:biopolymer transport protein ExbD